MNTNEELYLTALDIARKDTKGNAFTVREFNKILYTVTNEYFIQQYRKYEATKTITDSLNPFLKQSTVPIAGGFGILPMTTDQEFFHMSGEPIVTNSTVPVDIVTELEYSTRVNDTLTAPSTTSPIGVMRWDSSTSGPMIYIYPSSITSIDTWYLKQPIQPFLDYYVDSSYNKTFLSVGESYTMVSGDTFPLGTSPGIGNSYASQTKEMEWRNFDRPSILYMILQKIGVAITDQMITEYSMQEAAKNDTI